MQFNLSALTYSKHTHNSTLSHNSKYRRKWTKISRNERNGKPMNETMKKSWKNEDDHFKRILESETARKTFDNIITMH